MSDAVQLPSTEADVDAEGDATLRLLTDALRTGPGSPEWAAAVEATRAMPPSPGLDEWAVLLTARDRLAAGRSYRSVRAGPGFGRRVMARVDELAAAQPQRGRSPLSPGLFALVGVGVVVGVIGLLLAILFRSGSTEITGQGDLATAYFRQSFASASLTGVRPPGWRVIGSLPLSDTDRLALSSAARLTAAYAGGGLVTQRAVPGDEPLSVQATFHFGRVVGPACVPQLFVTDRPDYSADKGVSPHELVWLVQEGQGQVAVADGQVAAPRVRVHDDVAVKVVVAADGSAAVVCNGQPLWSGASGLVDRPRFGGVRLLYRTGDRREAVTVTGLEVKQR